MQPRRQHLIDTALTLFNQQGYHATGIDLILSQAKVSKATLYKHFRSKDELILAVLEQRHHQVLSMLSSKIDDLEKESSLGIFAIFDALHEWFNSDTFYGCNFINASAEYSDAQHPIFLFSQKHKQQVVELIKTKLPAGNESKADQIDLLIEGAIVMAHTRGMKKSALMAKEMAKKLILPSD
ncbi:MULTISPECIES: TetR/AcrR family transcriptional regulator [Colwellia]|jgi:AcrR family transcriptional regulator|uniref:Transcriptional regulator, TetR family n=1 Tax=Colwellia psychrerythraea (strain 34H / ATCC BAA-681) TaxID=167879 RepID=Q486G7_COLP3|nr:MULTISPECIES: TetR/AcrR family transcriptional regulator [Colwellia]AAZ28255.1 transcriptional regulator, TetR family [Colwellia psychrerythraea 34H]PKH88558.1 TetR/AcrR family transcriptional regulator [Colwellia sp. Bg11-28]